MDKQRLRKFLANPELSSYEDTVSLNEKIKSLVTALKEKKASETDVIYNIKGKKGDKGDKGDTPEKGIDYWTKQDIAELTDSLRESLTPVKGKDYFTPAELREFASYILQGATPVKGKDYRDGIDGKDGRDGINGKDGKNGRDGKDGKDGKDPEYKVVEEAVKKVFKDPKFQIEKRSIKGFDMSDQRWHGSGGSSGSSVTSVGATSPITSTGGTNPVISTSVSSGILIGRGTAGTGVMEEITLGTNLSLTGTTLNATGGSSTSFVDNEIVSGSGTTFTLANTPIAGSVHLYGNGQRLTPGIGNDYTISGATITIIAGSYTTGSVLADYRK